MTASLGYFFANSYCASIEPIRRVLACYGSRRDSETSWLLDARTPTNLTDTLILSQKTKRGAEWDRSSRAGCLQIWPGQNRTKTGQGRAGQGRLRSGKAAFISFRPFDIFVDCTRVSAMPIFPISQHTFVWITFLTSKKILKNFTYHIFLNSVLRCYECNHWQQFISPAFRDWPPKHWCWPL